MKRDGGDGPRVPFRATRYFVTPEISLEDRDPEGRHPERGGWAITRAGSCFNREGEWEWEPLPSSRDDEYLMRNRYTFVEAVEKAQALAKLAET
jgi:hypothetical protein